MKNNHSTGFTIVELMIATTIFSVVLILISVGMIQVGRQFFKGSTISATQDVARTILEDISQSIQFSGEAFTQLAGPDAVTGGFCVGSRRYTFKRGEQLTASNHVLLVDKFTTACNGGTPLNNLSSPVGGSRELMGRNMRLVNVEVKNIAASSYIVTVRVAYGDDDLLCSQAKNDCDTTAPSTNLTERDLQCKNFRDGSQFCAVSELQTTVQRRIN
jgi:prepilin-type N-terminal cleavage/methylation domain-containing protein